MKKEYIIVRIDASPDGSPYVIISLSTSKDFREQSSPPSPFGSGGVMGFTNMDDMVKNLNKMISGGGVGQSSSVTSIKLDMHEYKEFNLAVGDKVFLEMTKAESIGV